MHRATRSGAWHGKRRIFLLPRTDHDRIHSERPRLALHVYLQAVLVKAPILHTDPPLNTAGLQPPPMNPAGGLPETGTGLGVLALEDPHLALRR
jgi:hypothetical protein